MSSPTSSPSPLPQAPQSVPPSATSTASPSGMGMVLGCYLLWGFFPLYFRLLSAAGPVEIIGHRVMWTLATCVLLVTARRRWDRVRDVLRTPDLLGAHALSGLLITLNWLIYVYGVNTGRTADAALGYFINPLVTVALAALFLRERLHRAQGLALVLASVAVLVLVVVQRALPWISLSLALSFGLYGLVKKRVSARVDALTGLTVESLAILPLALIYLGQLQLGGHAAMQGSQASSGLLVLLVLAGPLTAVPLLLFGAGTARVPLSVVGLSQYLTPLIQFLLAWAVFHEEIAPARWLAMGFVWAAVLVLVADLARQAARRPWTRSHG